MMATNHESQSGVALLLTMLAILLASGSYWFMQRTANDASVYASVEKEARTLKLLQAKQALLSYTVAYSDNYLPTGAGPGHLPCPDRSPIGDNNESNDGPDPPCSGDGSNSGRFPRFTYSRDQSDPERARKRIEFYPERSYQDQQMWYVVSRSHINNPVNTVVNPATKGELLVDSIEDVVAVILEPGRDLLLSNPQRPGDTAAAYLEGENADDDQQFTQLSNHGGNDLLAYITAKELMKHTRPRVTLFVQGWLQEYRQRYCGRPNQDCYPAAANEQGVCQSGLNKGYLPIRLGDCAQALTDNALLDAVEYQRHWFSRNGWFEYYRYRRHPNCIDDQIAACDISVAYSEKEPDVILISIEPGQTGAAKSAIAERRRV